MRAVQSRWSISVASVLVFPGPPDPTSQLMRKAYSGAWRVESFDVDRCEISGRPIARNGRERHRIGMDEAAIDAGVRMGHVHLKVADLERALGFYRGVLGFQLMQRFETRRRLSRLVVTITISG
jgi:hypothetical protein